ncbi:hypothetical protein SARC_06456 [Sphaeroforma arctica JP610]|uniref:Tyrosine-protein phosphatase domain-containing protein n=1 Tax=Sphaeroforma arctica JP610 TaxID=667725 RepID=A0A0L0FX46_9EUKA|nr:hypothetical protein SARC_06456 [Sphaeroforma arctica JP610]KNC81209.1 hypothetical protein SARC_06456 [Sphaeroforma arctica JP610]|eukprot:XP_014155111.1 hypothetical protein SARC_06456 [Sphaeroforma arctica JP610]
MSGPISQVAPVDLAVSTTAIGSAVADIAEQNKYMTVVKAPSLVARNLLVPPLNFSMVASGVYRSGYPGTKNYSFLRKLGLRTVVCLSDIENLNADFYQTEGIRFIHMPIVGNKEPFTRIPEDVASEVLDTLLDRRNHPVLIHCNKGKHRVGCMIGCLRKAQKWSMIFLFDEYQRFSGTKVRILDQQFIELFNIDTIAIDKRKQLAEW